MAMPADEASAGDESSSAESYSTDSPPEDPPAEDAPADEPPQDEGSGGDSPSDDPDSSPDDPGASDPPSERDPPAEGGPLDPDASMPPMLPPADEPAATEQESPSPEERQPDPVDDYIVVYVSSVRDVSGKTDALEREEGFDSDLRYRRAIKGFSAELSRRQVREVEADPQVDFVSPDRKVQATASTPLADGETAPTGVRREEAASATSARERSDANVAVIDTGVDLDHPDLNVRSGTNCVGSGSPDDDNGHGTHVAGTIGAENDGAGVVGVAPGTRIYAAKVLDAAGGGTWSSVLCGIDWATATRTDGDSSNDIEVANMSLGGVGDPVESCSVTTDALHKAVCRATQAGITYVVAAGNEGYDFDFPSAPDVPAAYPEALTVTAASDSDGAPGGAGGGPGCDSSETDDAPASFSNYAATSAGEDHAIAAPGVCIRSTWMNGGYRTISGTSMAAPHVAGATALCIDESGSRGPCAGKTPSQVIDQMRSQAASHSASTPSYGFEGDPLRPIAGRYFGHLARVGVEEVASDGSPPAAPTGLEARAGDASVALDWADNGESDLAGYDVYHSTTAGGPYAKLNTTPVTTSAYTDAGLTNGTTYHYVVRAVDSSDAVSEPSNEASVTPSPPVVKDLSPVGYTLAFGKVYDGRGALSRLLTRDDKRVEIEAVRPGSNYVAEVQPYASITAGERSALRKVAVSYEGNASGSGTSTTVAIYNHSAARWETIDGPLKGATKDRKVEWSNTAAPTDYVSLTGEIRLSVRGSASASFRTRTDFVRFSTEY